MFVELVVVDHDAQGGAVLQVERAPDWLRIHQLPHLQGRDDEDHEDEEIYQVLIYLLNLMILSGL